MLDQNCDDDHTDCRIESSPRSPSRDQPAITHTQYGDHLLQTDNFTLCWKPNISAMSWGNHLRENSPFGLKNRFFDLFLFGDLENGKV